MSLITRLKIGNVNNLSDARYAAGVGADFIGFCFDLENPMYISPEKVKEILGWIEGPSITGEFGFQDIDEVCTYRDMLGLDFIQFNDHRDKTQLQKIESGVFQTINLDQFSSDEKLWMYLEDIEDGYDYLLLSLTETTDLEFYLSQDNKKELVKEICSKYPTFLDFRFSKDNIIEFIEEFEPEGINLNGESEIKPGYRDFERLIELVELIEE